MIKSVLIDFDDTLCPTMVNGFAFENEILRLMHRPAQDHDVFAQTWGRPMLEAIAIRSPGIDVEQFRITARTLMPQWVDEGKFDVIPQVNLKALDKLLSMGKEIYIVTSRTHDELNHLLAADHALARRIKAFYYHELLDHHKPDPRVFDKVLTAHGLMREDCVYVGDSPSDAAASTQAGLRFIANLENGLRTPDDFDAWRIDAYMERFAELPQAIEILNYASKRALFHV